jgi:glycosyltransferase involved in cell wall biosynthesis
VHHVEGAVAHNDLLLARARADRFADLPGGLDLLEAFSILASRYPNVRLILRTALPPDLDSRYLRIIQDYPIEVVDQFLPTNHMEELLSNVDIYVLPSARLHVVSILEAMAHGLAVVVSDGWGITEYVEHYRNGIVVRGRYGKCSWMDVNGMLREDYSPLFASDPLVVSGLVDSLSTLIEDRDFCERLGKAARKDIETKFSIENWNRGLKKVFDRALS